jgi:hypothetical protein
MGRPYCSVHMLADALTISKLTCHQILREDLGKRKLNARLVPHTLTQDQKEMRTSICANLLREAQNDSTFVNSIITKNESWCFQYDPQTKRQGAEWWSMGSPASKKVRQQPSQTESIIIVFFMPGVSFNMNSFRRVKQSTKNSTSPYSGICTRNFDIVVMTCRHQDCGLVA